MLSLGFIRPSPGTQADRNTWMSSTLLVHDFCVPLPRCRVRAQLQIRTEAEPAAQWLVEQYACIFKVKGNVDGNRC
jgi:hypothetical protein